MIDNQLTLNMVKPGCEVVVSKVYGCMRFRKRLIEMGIMKGAKVKVERVAPLGDPMEIKISGYHLSIRKCDAVNIIVKAIPDLEFLDDKEKNKSCCCRKSKFRQNDDI